MGLTRQFSSLSTPGQLWGLVDCNNFYASCEKLFRPDLADKPLVVLSGNDGCIIARSAEAKALGIKMGEPLFKIKKFLEDKGVAIFSSNFALYHDLSARVMSTLEEVCPTIEQYSVDEAFIPLTGALLVNAEDVAVELKRKVLKDVGIPVSVGVAPTRTLAKVANHIAKKGAGTVVLRHDANFEEILAHTPVTEIWGIGRKQAEKCWGSGISTALQLTRASDAWIRKVLTIAGLNTVNELRGIPSVGECLAPVARKTMVRSQSFGQRVLDKQIIGEAVCTFVARAAEDLRQEGLVTNGVGVHIRTSRFNTKKPFYENYAQTKLPHGSADTALLNRTALNILDSIFREGYEYAKAGVMFFNLEPVKSQQNSLLVSNADVERRRGLMEAMDKINAKHGRVVKFGAEGMKKSGWEAKREHLSPEYTTKLSDLRQVRC